jgi:predicted nucleic acid-binding protein
VIVLDASAVIDLLLNGEHAPQVAARIGDESIHAPHLVDVEVGSALRRYLVADVIDARSAAGALASLADLGLERYEHGPFLPRVLELRETLTAYDALYVALAEALDAPLVTLDAKLGRSHGHRATVELL